MVLLAVVWAGHPRYGVRAAIRWAPVVLVPAAIAVFAVFEYSRSGISTRPKQADHL